MKRTIYWILFAVFILYFGYKNTKTPVSHKNSVNKTRLNNRYDTIYVYEDGYDWATTIRAKHHRAKFIGIETGYAVENDSIDKLNNKRID